MPKDTTFTDLNIPQMRFSNGDDNNYLVYSDKDNFTQIKADNAADAIEKSGIANPYKVIHEVFEIKTILGENEILPYKQDKDQPIIPNT